MKNLSNYKSLVIGTREDCLNSKYAFALDLSYEPNSKKLTEIKRDLQKKLGKNEVIVLERLSVDLESGVSIFKKENIEKAYTFNSIIFGDETTINAALKYVKTQTTTTLSDDLIESLKIELTVPEKVQTSDEDIELLTLLVTLSETIEEKKERTGEELYKFKPTSYYRTFESYSKYTSRINQLIEDPSMAVLSGECGVSGNKGSWGFWINSYDDYFGYDKIGLCFWNSDLCSLKYDTQYQKYELTSMTKYNTFKKAWMYRSGVLSFDSNSSFYRILGPNIIYISDYYYHIYSVLDNLTYKVLRFKNGFPMVLVSDPWNIMGPLEFISTTDLYERLGMIAPSEYSFDRGRDSFIEKIGGWYKLKYGPSQELTYFGPRGVIADPEGKTSLITENLLLYKNKDRFQIIPQVSEKIKIRSGKIMIESSNSGVIKKDGKYYYNKVQIEEDDIIIESGNKDIVKLTQEQDGDPYSKLTNYLRVILDGLRRKPFRMVPKMTNILSFCGLLFYEENKKLYLF